MLKVSKASVKCLSRVQVSLKHPHSMFHVHRRFIWNFFRLENEHLNNCGQFRAVRDISVAPKDSSDQTQIIRMMDEESGVLNRSKKKGKKVKEEKQPLMSNSIEMEAEVKPGTVLEEPNVKVKPSTVKTKHK
jgi:hypothetical protein